MKPSESTSHSVTVSPSAWNLCLFSLAAVLMSTSASGDNILSTLKYAAVVSTDGLKELQNSQAVSVVYFYVKELPNNKVFFKEYDTSAKYLEAYDVKLAVFDCTSDMTKEPGCEKENVEQFVYTYQNGLELLPLEVETMFDLNSIMSNTLQLVLLHEVPIISSRLERQELEKDMAGKFDIIFAYLQAVGTQEHRIFMEIAYIFQDRYKFALTTELKTLDGLQDVDIMKSTTPQGMWVMFCTESNMDKSADHVDCRSILYRGLSGLSDVATFVKRLGEQTRYNAPEHGTETLFQMSGPLPIIYVYIDKDTSKKAEAVIDLLAYDVRGFTKLVVVDMDNDECKKLATNQGMHQGLPAVSIKTEDGQVRIMDPSTKWIMENVQDFLVSYSFPSSPTAEYDTELVSSPHLNARDALDRLMVEVENQDDQVADAVFRAQKKEMDLEFVPALLKNTFHTAVKQADLLMVLMYLPFDAVSMAFLRDFGNAAQTLAQNFSDKNVLARVNCFDATDLCSAENITTYPVLRIYRRSPQVFELYQGSLDAASVVRAIKLLQLGSPVKLMSEENVEKFVSGHYPSNFSEFSSNSVLLISSGHNKDIEKAFQDVSRALSTTTAFGIVEKDELAQKMAEKYSVSLPAIISFNRMDPNQPIRTKVDDFGESAIKEFVKQSTIPIWCELTVENFPILFARKQPFVILFLDKTDPISKSSLEIMSSVAISGQFPNVILCWMNAQVKTMGLKILSEYTWTATLPWITVVNHSKGELFNHQASDLKMEDFVNWLTRVVKGNERPSKMLREGKWEAPGKYYDFLTFMEQNIQEFNHPSPSEEDLNQEESKQQEEYIEPEDTYLDNLLKIDSDVRQELLKTHKPSLSHQNRKHRHVEL